MLISGFEPKRVSSNLKQHRNEIYRTACLRVITRVEWVGAGFPQFNWCFLASCRWFVDSILSQIIEWVKKDRFHDLPSSFAPWAPSGQVRGCRNLPGIALPSRRKSDLEVVVRGLVEKYQISRAIENRTHNTTLKSLQKSFPCDVDSSVYDVGVRGLWQVSRIIESFHKILLTRPIENPNHIPTQKSY